MTDDTEKVDLWYVIKDLKLENRFSSKITIEEASSNAKKEADEEKDVPWVFFDYVLKPRFDGRGIILIKTDKDTGDETPAIDESNDDDLFADFQFDYEPNSVEKYKFYDITIVTLLCCDYLCKQELAKALCKATLSVPLILPDPINKDKFTIQSSLLKGILKEGEYESNKMPVISFICCNQEPNAPLKKTKTLNNLASDYTHKPFTCEFSHFVDGVIDVAVNRNKDDCSVCQKNGICPSHLKRDVLLLNLYGSSGDFLPQQEFVCKISTIVVIVVNSASLDEKSLDTITDVIKKSNKVLLVGVKEDGDDVGKCRKGFERLQERLKEEEDMKDAEVLITYNRKSGEHDDVDFLRGHMKIRIDAMLKKLSPRNISLIDILQNGAGVNFTMEFIN